MRTAGTEPQPLTWPPVAELSIQPPTKRKSAQGWTHTAPACTTANTSLLLLEALADGGHRYQAGLHWQSCRSSLRHKPKSGQGWIYTAPACTTANTVLLLFHMHDREHITTAVSRIIEEEDRPLGRSWPRPRLETTAQLASGFRHDFARKRSRKGTPTPAPNVVGVP